MFQANKQSKKMHVACFCGVLLRTGVLVYFYRFCIFELLSQGLKGTRYYPRPAYALAYERHHPI